MPEHHTRPGAWDFIRLMRMDRPIGAFLLLWPTLWALWFAGRGAPDPTVVVIFVAGVYVMRAAGCVINDFADRKFDPHVQRTRDRPLASGRVTPLQSMALFVVLMGVALALVLQLNLAANLVAVAAAGVTVIYPFTKRFTHLPQLVLGVAFSMGIPMSFAALTGGLPWAMWPLFLASFLWIVAYDTQYAMADRDDDLMIGIKSTAILFGRYDNLANGLLQAGALALLAGLGALYALSWHYYLGLLGAAVFAVYQQVLCRNREPDKCFRAFLNNNWFGAVVFCGIVLSFIDASSR